MLGVLEGVCGALRAGAKFDVGAGSGGKGGDAESKAGEGGREGERGRERECKNRGEAEAEREREKEREAARMRSKEAREALKVERLFAREYWNGDGTWAYEVGGEEVTFEEVVEQHPLVREWTRRAREELRKWGVREGAFEGVEWEAGRVG